VVRDRFPLLSSAILNGASAQLRNMATTDGNVMQRTRCYYFYDVAARCNKRAPGSGCDAVDGFNRMHAILGASPHCIATHPSDMCVALAALDAAVNVIGPSGERTLPFLDFHRLPGNTPHLDTNLQPGKLITSIDLPGRASGLRSAYRKVRDRASYAFALVAVAAAWRLESGMVRDARLALGGVAHKPWRAAAAELVGKITEAIVRVLPDHDRDDLRQARRYIGQPVDRLDGRDKVTGRALFSAEYPIESLVHGALVYSTIPKGVVERIDTSDAERAPGVIRIITHLDAPAMVVPKPMGADARPSSGTTSVKILNTDRITWNGQPVAVVVAETEEQAEHAASLVRVAYSREPAITSFDASIPHATTPREILGESPKVAKGDPDAALKSASHAVDLTFTTPPYNHNAIEPHATIAVWDGDSVTVYDSTQFTAGAAASIAQAVGVPRENVRLLAPFVGGGFGGKAGCGRTRSSVPWPRGSWGVRSESR
jgi:CO/xanthine dehydrogenase FAD-binding subunit